MNKNTFCTHLIFFKRMPHKAILAEDWSEYDNRKIKEGSDQRNFACTEAWEIDYLVKKIHNRFPYSETIIRTSIASCCKAISSPHSRERFVECVLKRLGW